MKNTSNDLLKLEEKFLTDVNAVLGNNNRIRKIRNLSADEWFNISEELRDISLSELARLIAVAIVKDEDPVKTLEDHKQLLSI